MDGFLFGSSVMGAAVVALLVDALFGEPRLVWGRLGHPVAWLGWAAGWLEGLMNRGGSRVQRGGLAWLVLLTTAVLAGLALQFLYLLVPWGWVVLGILASVGLAARSLDQHVRAVAQNLDQGLEQGRTAVGQIVGRDLDRLDEAGVARAAIESLAENSSDGVLAPLFWFVLLGLPGLCAYKTINTLDSLWGHRTARFERFGKIAARMDDAVNWLPARLTAFGVSLVSGTLIPLAIAWRDGPRHGSVNAGWPEAAFAGALNLSLAGPRSYGGQMTSDAPMGSGSRSAGPAHIRAALRLFWYLWALAFGLCLSVFLLGML